jgi:hypothetical protein
MGSYSDLLYPQPGFVEGAARIMDFTNSLTRYNESRTPEEADEIAVRADAAAVAEDMHKALIRVREEADAATAAAATSER